MRDAAADLMAGGLLPLSSRTMSPTKPFWRSAEEHERLVEIIERVVEPAKAGVHAALDDHGRCALLSTSR